MSETSYKVAELCAGYGYTVSMPKGIYDREASAWTATPQKDYPPDLVQNVRETYEQGHTMRETADIVGTTVKVLQRLMPRHGIERRPAIKRDQCGPNNDSWKGDSAGNHALHLRIVAAYGKATEHRCVTCDGPAKEWANQTGDYLNIDDFSPMCFSCHRTYDAKRRRETGRRTMPDWGSARA